MSGGERFTESHAEGPYFFNVHDSSTASPRSLVN